MDYASELFKVYAKRNKEKPVSAAIPSTKNVKILAGYGDVACNSWVKEIEDRLATPADKAQAMKYAVDTEKGAQAVMDIFKMGKQFFNKVIYRLARFDQQHNAPWPF